jgi:plasmid stabilization system protein ParE
MSYQVQLHPLAVQEIEESYQWYEERSPGLGGRFIEAIQEKFESISSSPLSCARKKGNYRDAIISSFPFIVIYEVIERRKIVFVSYVFHSKRNPKLKYKR